jgi:anti-sigma factor RsiW
MDCRKCENLIEGYLHGELTDREHVSFESHLKTCGDCREQVAEFQALEVMLDRASEWKVEAPPFLAERIMANLPSSVASGFWSWKVLRPVVVACSLVLALTIGFFGRDLLLQQQVGVPPHAQAQQVRIIFYSPEASSVALIGDFNEWGQREVTMAQAADRGIWEFSMSLKPGVYHYNLLVDGEKWVANPKSSTLVPDGYGGYDSVLVVSEKCQDDCT